MLTLLVICLLLLELRFVTTLTYLPSGETFFFLAGRLSHSPLPDNILTYTQQITKVQHNVKRANPSLQRSTSNCSGHSSDANTCNSSEDKDTSNPCEDKVMRKRVQSAAAKEEVKGLQDVREKLAKMLGYKVYPGMAKKTPTTVTAATTEEKKAEMEGEEEERTA